jgi:hypothetical protein
MKRSLLVALLLLAPCTAFACISFPPDPQNAARGTVLIGYVTGEVYPDWEASLIKNGPGKYALFGRRVVRVAFTQAITGELIGSLEVETPCYASVPKLGERAIVVRLSGSDYVVPATPEYESAIQSAAQQRNGR